MKFIKPLLKVILSVVVILGVIVGAGVGYIWWSGQQGVANASLVQKPIEQPKKSIITPTKPRPGMPVGASVQLLTTPVKPGSNATINIKTVPTASCKITVEYNKVASKDSGLKDKAADPFGNVSWTWTVEETAPLGTWPVKVSCTYTGKTGVVIGDLVVSNKTD